MALHFSNCKANSSFWKFKVVIHITKCEVVFPKESLIHPHFIFFHIICSLYHYFIDTLLHPIIKKILLIAKTTWKNEKNTLQFLQA